MTRLLLTVFLGGSLGFVARVIWIEARYLHHCGMARVHAGQSWSPKLAPSAGAAGQPDPMGTGGRGETGDAA